MYQRVDIAVRELNPDDPEQLAAVCDSIRERGFKETAEVVRMMHAGNRKEAENARAVLMEIGELALSPMLDHASMDKPADLVWDMQAMVSFHLENRARLVKWLEEMLSNKTVVPPQMFPLGVEEMPPTMRLCDHGYLMMRQLFALEDEETELVNQDAFLDMTDEERDKEIARARETRKWITLTEAD